MKTKNGRIILIIISGLVLILTGIINFYFQNQKSYQRTPQSQDNKIINMNTPGTEGTLSGTIQRTTRPAPDIAYDYMIVLDQPLTGITTGEGDNQSFDTFVIQSPAGINLDDYVGKNIKFVATLEWGYAESRVLMIKNLLEE